MIYVWQIKRDALHQHEVRILQEDFCVSFPWNKILQKHSQLEAMNGHQNR